MRNCLILLCSIQLCLSQQMHAQSIKDSTTAEINLIGIWQLRTDVLGSGMGANFRFFKNGTFIYNKSSYDEINPLVSIMGTYYVDNNKLKLKIKQYKQWVGYKVIASEPAWQFGSFQLDEGKLVTVDQNDSTYSTHAMTVLTKDKTSSKKGIRIDSDKYYKVSNDPASADQ